MPKILHITKHYPPYVGGIETVCKDICDSLAGKAEQLVIAFNDDKETIDEVYDGVRVIRVGVQRVVASQPLAKGYGKVLREAISSFEPDIIHFDYPNPFSAFFLKKALRKSRFQGKLVLFWHMDIIKQKVLRLLFVPQTKYLIRRADHIIVTSPNYLHDTSFLPKVKDKPISIVPLCVGPERLTITKEDQEKAEKIRAQYPGQKLVFFFGRHVPYKGLEYLIRANERLNPAAVKILIGGSGPLTEELKKKASQMENVVFLGRLNGEDINAYLLAADVFAFPSISRNEAFGVSLAEALFFGKPAVTFHIVGSGVNYVSLDGVTGLEAPNGDTDALAENIEKLIRDQALYSKLSAGAKKRAIELFSREAFAANIQKIFLEKPSEEKEG